MLYRLGRWRTQLTRRPADVVMLVFLTWGLACWPFALLFYLNTNRVNHFFLPCIVLAAWVTAFGITNLRADVPKQLMRGLVLLYFLVQGSMAAFSYLVSYPEGPIMEQFYSELPLAFQALAQLGKVEQVRITSQIPLSYVYTLFYLRYPPARFQREVQRQIIGGEYKVKRFGKYVFDDQYLTPGRKYAYLMHNDELPAEVQHRKQVLFSTKEWEVGTIQPLPASVALPPDK